MSQGFASNCRYEHRCRSLPQITCGGCQPCAAAGCIYDYDYDAWSGIVCRSCPLSISCPHRSPDIALTAAMEAAFGPPQSSPTVPTIPEDEEVELEATVKRGKSQQGTIGACDACRMRKVRCLANEDSRSSKCQRCARASRECV